MCDHASTSDDSPICLFDRNRNKAEIFVPPPFTLSESPPQMGDDRDGHPFSSGMIDVAEHVM
jgi:hypothetical protein